MCENDLSSGSFVYFISQNQTEGNLACSWNCLCSDLVRGMFFYACSTQLKNNGCIQEEMGCSCFLNLIAKPLQMSDVFKVKFTGGIQETLLQILACNTSLQHTRDLQLFFLHYVFRSVAPYPTVPLLNRLKPMDSWFIFTDYTKHNLIGTLVSLEKAENIISLQS